VAAASAAGAKSAAIAFDDEYRLRLGGVELRMLYFGSAYSDADAVVYFPDLTNAPMPDFAAGGTLVHGARVLDEVLKLDFTVVVGTRGGPRTRADLEAFKNRIETLVAQAGELVQHGAAPEQPLGATARHGFALVRPLNARATCRPPSKEFASAS